MTQNSNLFISIGKQIKDEYGRTIGKATSFAVNPNGRINSIYIEQGNGKIMKCPAENLKVEDSGIILLSRVKMEAKTLLEIKDQFTSKYQSDSIDKEPLFRRR